MKPIPLTKRENEVGDLLAWGGSIKEISDCLYISTRTVENTVRSVYHKTGIKKANEFSAYWFCAHYHITSWHSAFNKYKFK